ncbi:DME family drug/metabolite transporter [Prauserella shujinwangii]|uniref:DME family drug/metabolite transporter n=1 Tax=Prauserella shujinwangii TaxID=1453103 RepID=A0A2T0LZJ8_9PSEU|nr:DMT family transporter [Prauserella shujinwangii]PRX49546.1 DME family drug/metabolite transporter [Prauserella shujinwangii]
MSTTVSSAGTRARAGSFSLLTAGVLWGTGGLTGSLLGDAASLHPLAVAAYRLLLGGAFTVLFLGCAGGLRAFPRTRAVLRRLLVAGALLAAFQACYFAAVLLTSVSVATMTTIGSVPVFVAVAEAVAERRRPAGATLCSVAIALLGLALLTGSPDGTPDRLRLFGGLAFALAAGAGFATLTMATRRPVKGLDPLRTTAFGLLAGGLLLLPLALWAGMSLPSRLDVLALVGYLGAVPTALAYTAYFRGLRTARPVLAALSALLEPLTATLLAVLLLGDRLGVAGWCGAVLLAGSLAVSYRRRG